MFWAAGNGCRWLLSCYVLWVQSRNFSFFWYNRLITKNIQVKCLFISIIPAVWLILPLLVEGLFWYFAGPSLALTKSLDLLWCGDNFFYILEWGTSPELTCTVLFTLCNGPVCFEGTMLQTLYLYLIVFHSVSEQLLRYRR